MFAQSPFLYSMLQCGFPKARFLRHGIICTIGPSSQKVGTLKELIAEGMTVARMNFSHGSYDYHYQTIQNVRKASQETGIPVAIALDTKGPEIRTGLFKDHQVVLTAGEECLLTTNSAVYATGTREKFYVDYRNLPKVVHAGSIIYVDDGNLALQVLEKNVKSDVIRCKVLNTHTLSGHRGVNLPEAIVDLPAVSEKDRDDIQFGVEQGVDYIFASFIRTPEHVDEVRSLIPSHTTGLSSSSMLIFSKIENQQGLDNIHSIADRSDGILIARGDLGVEIPLERVVVEQKRLTRLVKNAFGKPVICATQMLESMIARPRPTRAEVADVTNAVLDGVDAVMLSGESANGQYPVDAVHYMASICRAADEYNRGLSHDHVSSDGGDNFHFCTTASSQDGYPHLTLKDKTNVVVCKAAVEAAQSIGAKAIICRDVSVVMMLSALNPFCPIVLVTHDEHVARKLSVWRGVVVLVSSKNGMENDRGAESLQAEEAFLSSKGYAETGDALIYVKVETKTKDTVTDFSVRIMQ